STIQNWAKAGTPHGTWENLTNGPFGISGIPPANVLGWVPDSPLSFAIFATSLAALCGFILWRLQSSPWGRLLLVTRDDELAARGLGKNTRLAKLQAVAISSSIVAVGGALYAAHVRYIDPSAASLDEGILMLSMVIVGGVGNFRGPVVGAAVLIALPEVLRFLQLPDSLAANFRLLIYGLLLVLIMHFRPAGLAGAHRVQ
ncbi:MAG: branched-chain amino acid ABC transporter permease, partial [Verrucomicrobiota bacterium]